MGQAHQRLWLVPWGALELRWPFRAVPTETRLGGLCPHLLISPLGRVKGNPREPWTTGRTLRGKEGSRGEEPGAS